MNFYDMKKSSFCFDLHASPTIHTYSGSYLYIPRRIPVSKETVTHPKADHYYGRSNMDTFLYPQSKLPTHLSKCLSVTDLLMSHTSFRILTSQTMSHMLSCLGTHIQSLVVHYQENILHSNSLELLLDLTAQSS